MFRWLALLLVMLQASIVTSLFAQKMKVALEDEVKVTAKISPEMVENLREKVREDLINSGKFDVIERNNEELKKLLDEQKSSDERLGRVDPDDARKATWGKIAGVEYFIMLSVKSYREGVTPSKFKQVNAKGTPYASIEVGLRLLNTSTARIKAAKSVTAQSSNASGAVAAVSKKAVEHILDELYPIRILEKMGQMVFINRGQEHGIKGGESLEVFALKPTRDPDTGEDVDLELSVGKLKVTSVSARQAQCQVAEDFGVDVGCIARLTARGTGASQATAPRRQQPSQKKEPEKSIQQKAEEDQDW